MISILNIFSDLQNILDCPFSASVVSLSNKPRVVSGGLPSEWGLTEALW